jgi:hypothetical protein
MDFSIPVTDIIRKRQSKRDYLNEPLSGEMVAKIEAILAENGVGPMGNTVKFSLIEKESVANGQKVKLGTYGFISGARYFIAGAVNLENPFALEDYGFLLEKIILHLTEMGLGTCWLGGTFSRSEFSAVLGNDTQMVIPSVTPVGLPTPSKSIRENLIRWGAKSNSRIGWDELFFNHDFNIPLSETGAGPFAIPLEMVRLAPSASNKQPWRIVAQGNTFHFYLLETPGYINMIKAVKLQRIDMGIAMAHFDVACNALGLAGSWKHLAPSIFCGEAQYVVSWEA